MDNVIIANFNLYTFELPLIASLRINDTLNTSRCGLIIALTDKNGITGFGEISPLPGLHEENLSDIINFFQKHHVSLPGEIRIAPDNYLHLPDLEKTDRWYRWPSLRFGITSAILDLQSRIENQALYKSWQQTECEEEILINALLTRQDDPAVYQDYIRENQFTSVKIKVGKNDVVSDIRKINNLRILLGIGIDIRIDANRSWRYQQACQFIQGINKSGIEYIEEPLADPADLSQLISEQKYPVALDESLPLWQDRGLLPDGLTAVVLKPAVIGSIGENLRWIDHARKNNIQVVISDTFHSGVGMQMIINLAVHAGGSHTPMGLDTYRWLARDLLMTKLPLPAGRLKVKNVNNLHITPRLDLLTKIL